jgi:tRNA pseudouridine38-40 synthase
MAQVAHADLERPIKAFSLMQGSNFHLLPEPIVIHQCEEVSEEFHARFSSQRRYYMYRILNRHARLGLEHNRMWQVPQALDVERMKSAAKLLIGTHDFSSFRDSDCQARSPIKTLDHLHITEQNTPLGREIHIHTHSKSFLHHQVRIMTGTLVWIGRGKWSEEHLLHALDAKTRSAGGPTAPAEGLYFMGVDY